MIHMGEVQMHALPGGLQRLFDQPTCMVRRNLERQPVKAHRASRKPARLSLLGRCS